MFCTGNWAPCGDAVCPQPPFTNVCDFGARMCADGFTPCGDVVCLPGESCLEQWPPPDHAANFHDIAATVFTFQQIPGLTVPAVMWVDMHGDAGGNAKENPPNYVANFADIQQIVFAFKSWPYPFNDPADCPDDGSWPAVTGHW